MNESINLTKLVDIEVNGIDHHDFPDYCDAYISNASLDLGNGQFRELTEAELDWLNDKERAFVYKKVWDSIH